jgi:hypothetical protein
MKHASLLAAAILAICPGFALAGAAVDSRMSEVQRRLTNFAYGSHSNDEVEAFVELCCGYPEAISLLVKDAADCNTSLAGQEHFHFICYLLTKLGPEAAPAVPLLLDRLAEGYPSRIRHEAGLTLAVVAKGSPAAAAALVEILQTSSDANLRSIAASSLGPIGDPAVIPQLVLALNDPDQNVRTSAGRSFGDFDAADLEARAHAKIVSSVELRPQMRNLSPIDAQQVQVNITYRASLLIDGKELWTSPTRYLCDYDTLAYEVTMPDRKKYRLTQRPTFVPPRRPARFDYGTYDIIDSQGIRWSDSSKYWSHWKERDTPPFDAAGTYRIKQSGIFKDERATSKPIAFESNEMCYEVSPRFAAHADLREQARQALQKELGIASPPTQENLFEDKDETKVVTLYISKEDYPEEKVHQTKRPSGQYGGMRFVCRFAPEGQLLSTVATPRYRIICP